jgi:hypothetical protein
MFRARPDQERSWQQPQRPRVAHIDKAWRAPGILSLYTDTLKTSTGCAHHSDSLAASVTASVSRLGARPSKRLRLRAAALRACTIPICTSCNTPSSRQPVYWYCSGSSWYFSSISSRRDLGSGSSYLQISSHLVLICNLWPKPSSGRRAVHSKIVTQLVGKLPRHLLGMRMRAEGFFRDAGSGVKEMSLAKKL